MAWIVALAWSQSGGAKPLSPATAVHGWTLLSNDEGAALITLAAASSYGINHLQLSHEIVHELRDIKEPKRCALVNRLIDRAHAAGIGEVVLWDHAFNSLDYYPKKFRSGPGGTLNLDDPEFWAWFKADYRAMLDQVPNADGLVLTFIETGARAELQFSKRLTTDQEKLAAVVNAVADVVIGERHLNLYARTFSYTPTEYEHIIGAIRYFARPEVRLMMKETPHDFFLTHPDDGYAGTIPRPTLIEFDAAGEYNGEAIIAGTWPEYILRRWRDFARRPNILGYVARTDRYGDTHLVGRPEEINLYTLKRAADDPNVTAEQIYDEFIAARYGAPAVAELKPAFKAAYDIVSSTLYILGTSVSNHSELNYDTGASFILHVSGNWIDPPIDYVGHGVGREFHYWRDIIDHIVPPDIKVPGNPDPEKNWQRVPSVIQAGWIHPGEGMDEQYLRYIVAEKSYGVARAEEALGHIKAARAALRPADYVQLNHHFQRTLLTARLHRATASAYFGFRVWSRGDSYRSAYVNETIRRGCAEIQEVSKLIRDYPVKPPIGQWNWTKDADQAEHYLHQIIRQRGRIELDRSAQH